MAEPDDFEIQYIKRSIKYIVENQDIIIQGAAQIKKLRPRMGFFAKDTMQFEFECVRDIWFYYEDACLSYLFALPYVSLDSTRKIIELLIRHNRKIHPDEDLRGIHKLIDQTSWSKEQKIAAHKIYRATSRSAHGQKRRIWAASKTHSKLHDKDFPKKTTLLDWMYGDEAKAVAHGIDGMPDYALAQLNKTIDLANEVLSTSSK